MKLLIDADGCPVVDIAVRTAHSMGVRCLIVCDTSHVFDKPGAETVTVSKGADSADFALVNLIEAGDRAVTQDYGLAAMCLAKRARVINQDGMEYTDDNIDSLLLNRHMAKKIRMSGGRIKGPTKRTDAQNRAFEEKLTQLLK